MTAFGTLETAIAAIRDGASDYLIKPVAIEEVISKVGRIIENVELRSSNQILKRDLDRKVGSLEMIGKSAALEQIRLLASKRLLPLKARY
jgi:DNA-binding NtrC family response regulator